MYASFPVLARENRVHINHGDRLAYTCGCNLSWDADFIPLPKPEDAIHEVRNRLGWSHCPTFLRVVFVQVAEAR